MKKNEYVIREVYSGSVAEGTEIESGDILVSINNEVIGDVFDYRYLIKDRYIEVVIGEPDEEEWLLETGKEYDDDLGVEFENGPMSGCHLYGNKCILRSIDQMPPGMRETLHSKDDDSRLSFPQGDYVTLTNTKERGVERTIRMQLAPINISVQATNPQLRRKVSHNCFAGDKPKYPQMLYGGHAEMNGQVVCCKNVNDGTELKRTVEDLSKYLSFLKSASVVPVGITKFRDGLFPIELYAKEETGAITDMVESCQQKLYDQHGPHFIYASDKWYITAGRDLSEEKRCDGYIQLENGAGMMRTFINEFNETLEDVINAEGYKGLTETVPRTLTIATGKLMYSTICGSAKQLMVTFPRLTVHMCFMRNDFFGKTTTVSGLTTEQDLTRRLKKRQDVGEGLGEVLQIPSGMLCVDEQVFLDGPTVQDVERGLGMKVATVESGGREFIDVTLDPEYRTERKNDNFVYIRVYGRNKKTQ